MTEPNKCACGHVAFGHDDGRGECFTSGCKCRTLTEPTDLDALIAEAQSFAETTDGDFYENQLVKALVAELRQERERADEAIRDLDAGFSESDHLSAKYYQRMRDAEREMHARELHHFEEEQRSAVLEAALSRAEETIERIKTLLDTPSDERGITWWEWIEGGLGGSLHDDLRAALTEYGKQKEAERG